MIEANRKPAFGASSVRKFQQTKKEEYSMPGPANYQIREKTYRPRRENPTANFASATRVHELTVEDTPGPTAYDVPKAYENLVGQWDCTQNLGAGQDLRDASNRWDTNGHGTHVAATIAGYSGVIQRRGEPLELYGVAPETLIYSYKVLANNGTDREPLLPILAPPSTPRPPLMLPPPPP